MRCPPLLSLLCLSISAFGQAKLEYTPAPADNPLKGMVPYVTIDAWERFPHSMQFHYFPLRDLMTGYETFDWSPIEEKLTVTQQRGKQLILRIMLEYPGKPNCVPQFLIDDGVRITRWKTDNTYEGVSHTPDYEDPKLRKALASFIGAFGKKYDGDPRIAYITAGILGSWGEWHNYSRGDDLWASKDTQKIVLDSYEAAFKRTPILHRYPAGADHWDQIENASRPLGYHDDSFNWATLDTGRKEDSWFFIPLLEKAGALDKWKAHPVGGELRPELWKTSFTNKPHEKAQGFAECVRQTHVTWLMDSGLFEKKYPLPESRKKNAIREVQRMGYEFHISSWERTGDEIKITVENRGVAPFYHDWPAELVAGDTVEASFDLRNILPGESKVWSAKTNGAGPFKLRVKNPMAGGKPLRFANKEQGDEWLLLPQ